jgi:hypothetical protein
MDKIKKQIPPYVSYKTFGNFLRTLEPQVPNRNDRRIWGDSFSGSTGTQLMTAMRFLNLIDSNSYPTARLKLLAPATGEHRAALQRQVVEEAYAFILKGKLDVKNATYAQLEELFQNTYHMKGDVRRKCIKFFVEFSKDAGLPLSPQITKNENYRVPIKE